MSMTIQELMQSLSECGLLSPDEISTIHDQVVAERRITSAEDFARELVRQNRLTKLQAAAVLQGKTKNVVFGDYIVLEKIGSGGMGQVFKAKHRPTGKLVALKVLSHEAVKNRRLIERFKKEARAVARLKHPNIVRAYEAGKINRIRYLVMEFVDGENMLDRVKRKGQLSVDETISCVLQAARGLDYAHQKGIIHRDIKPSNFMRDRKGRVKILDMGLARVEDAEEDDAMRLTIPGQMLGTARFMAPEQIEDARKSDVRSDIYSLGCTLYFLLRGKAPFSGETIAHTLMAHVSAPIPELCKKRTDVPEWLGQVFQKMLAKRPRDRYQSMAELVDEIQKHLGEDLSRHENLLIDEHETEDDFIRYVAKKDAEGSSLEELYSEDEPPSQSEDFSAPASADIAQFESVEDPAGAAGFQSEDDQRSRPFVRSEVAEFETADNDASSQPATPAKPAVSPPRSDKAAAPPVERKPVSAEPPATASAPQSTASAPAAPAKPAETKKTDVSPAAPAVPDAGAASIAHRLKQRRRQESASLRRWQIAAGIIGGLIALATIGWLAR